MDEIILDVFRKFDIIIANLMEKFNENVNQILEMAYGLGPNSKPITQSQLVDYLLSLGEKGMTPFSVTQITKQATRKAPYPKFTLPGLKNGATHFAKVAQVNGNLNFDYEGNVNTQRMKENLPTDFKKEEGWSKPITKSVHELEGQLYLYYRPIASRPAFSPVYVVATDDTANNFKIVPSTDVEMYKAPTPEYTKQGVEDVIQVRKISVDSIAAIKIEGQEYTISDLDPIRQAIFNLVQPKG